MKYPNKWAVLWRAVIKWWRNAPPLAPYAPHMDKIVDARNILGEYRTMYARRIRTKPQYGEMAAAQFKIMDVERQPSLEGEVRILAATLVQIIDYLDYEARRQHEITRPEYFRHR